eukprot:1007181-Prymnesium_polylepis.2
MLVFTDDGRAAVAGPAARIQRFTYAIYLTFGGGVRPWSWPMRSSGCVRRTPCGVGCAQLLARAAVVRRGQAHEASRRALACPQQPTPRAGVQEAHI